MKVYECEYCEALYPVSFVQTWGTTKETDGHGGQPRCTALVPNPKAPPPRDSMGRILNKPALQNCGGPLELIEEPDTTERVIAPEPEPIEEGRRL